MKSPTKVKDVQRLTGCIASLNRFIARATDRSLPFFKALKKGADFVWTDECEQSFQELKVYLGRVPLLSKPVQGEVLSIYLAVSEAAVSAALIREEQGAELPVFYVSKALIDPETRYPDTEKIALALVVAARKLRPYFQSHTILVHTKAPLRQILQNPECSGRLAKWSVELSKFDIQYKPRTAIKGQAVADFILEFIASDSPPSETSNEEGNDDSPGWETSAWVLFVDGASNKARSGGGVVLQNPSREKITRAFKFDFTVTNNEAEYEALIIGLRMAKDLDVQKIVVFCDSQLVVNQITDTFGTKGPRLATYLQFAKDLVYCFESFQILHVPREANIEADRLARIGSGQEIDPLCPVIMLSQSSLDGASVNLVEEEETWMTLIIRYLVTGECPIDKNEARKLRRRSAHYAYKYEQLYKRGYSVPLLKCITPERGLYVMQEIHEGVCGNHSGPRSLFHKVILQGYY
ncbi:hypothetical protein UlMin_017825 [Ulmus minor]